MKKIKKIIELFKKYSKGPLEYARCIGVTVGEHTLISDYHHWSSEPYLISIGDNCMVTTEVKFFTHGGGSVFREDIPDYDSFGKIVVGNNVYIGSRSLIMPGVIIEDNVVIAAGSVVTKSIPGGVVVAGNPARIICTLGEYKKRNMKYNTHSKGMSLSEKEKYLKGLDEKLFLKKGFMKI